MSKLVNLYCSQRSRISTKTNNNKNNHYISPPKVQEIILVNINESMSKWNCSLRNILIKKEVLRSVFLWIPKSFGQSQCLYHLTQKSLSRFAVSSKSRNLRSTTQILHPGFFLYGNTSVIGNRLFNDQALLWIMCQGGWLTTPEMLAVMFRFINDRRKIA